ncbi:MAG: nucleotidyl transferase AbiEii/AbiGii toxin family protein [Caldilineales bacterium]|nr:nucleotidyl transferase AbiEii/AbiGii toxin family protein [Caldilineales bacterium]
MDQQLAESLSRELKIAVEHVVREEYEMLILRELLASPLSNALVFKGGTALRLAYGSPRFSDDLDFSLLAPVEEEVFVAAAATAAKAAAQVRLVEALAKQFTLFALYRVTEAFLPYAFSIKVEVSTRVEPWQRGADFEIRLLTSPVTPISVLAQVATLERLWADKQAALAARREPRDLYDLWFIAQKLRRPFTPDLSGLDPKVVRRELRKYLPMSHWAVIEAWSANL